MIWAHPWPHAALWLTLLTLCLVDCQWAWAGQEGIMTGQARQHRVCELTFDTGKNTADPFRGPGFTVTFRGPGERRLDMRGFYDGGEMWRVRFTPPTAGEWHWQVSSHDPCLEALKAKQGVLQVELAGAGNSLDQHGGILQVSGNGRYLCHSDGTPFFWLGDTWWFCPSDLVPMEGSTLEGCPSMYRKLVDTRQAQGYTIVQMAFLGELRGIAATDLIKGKADSQAIAEYWQQVDQYINYANAVGIVPVIGMTFHGGMDAFTLDEWKLLWQYVVARYGAHSVTWLITGEYNQADVGKVEERVPKTLALGQFIHDSDPYRRAMTVHPWWQGGDKRQAWDQPWYGMIMFQGGHVGHGKVVPSSVYASAYQYQPTKPMLEAEVNYEGIWAGQAGREHLPEDVRRCAYWAMQCGSFGFTYGAHGLWYPTQNVEDKMFSDWGQPMVWWESLQRQGAAELAYLRQAYERMDWWKLEPWPQAVKLQGDARPEGCYPVAKGSPDASEVVVYFPPGFKPGGEVRMTLPSRASGAEIRWSGRWFNPRNGEQHPVEQPLHAADGVCVLPTPPTESDWLLLVKTAWQ